MFSFVYLDLVYLQVSQTDFLCMDSRIWRISLIMSNHLWMSALFERLCQRICNKTGQCRWDCSNDFQHRLALQCHCRWRLSDLTAIKPISAICPSVHRHRYVSCSSVSTDTFISYTDCHITECQLSRFILGQDKTMLKKMQFVIFVLSMWKLWTFSRLETIRVSLHDLLTPAWFLSRYSGIFSQCTNMPVTTVNCQLSDSVKGTQFQTGSFYNLLFHGILTIQCPTFNWEA